MSTSSSDSPNAAAIVPGPRAFPAVGHTWNYLQFFNDPISIMRQHFQQFGSVSGAYQALQPGQKGTVFAFGPQFNQQVLSNPSLFHVEHVGSLPQAGAANRLMTGLGFQNGELHKRQRRLIMPAFHKRYIETYRDAMVAVTQHILDQWMPGQPRDMYAEMRQLSQQVALKTLFGLDIGEDSEQIGDKLADWLRLLGSPLTHMFHADIPGLPFHDLLIRSQELEDGIKAVIARKRASATPGDDVLTTLLNARDEDGSALTEDEVIGQTNVLFLAGHETTANALTWTLFLLAQHPDIMADTLDELSGELGGEAPTVEQTGKLPLLERVINESMRLLPPITWVSRRAEEPFDLGSYSLPAGTTVIISHYMTHHLPELYPEPEKFWPDRWLNMDPGTYEYIPFSAGPRMCMGAHFAMMEMKIALAMMLQRFRLEMPAGAKVDRKITFTLKPKNGLPMLVYEQDRCFTCPAITGDVREMVNLVK